MLVHQETTTDPQLQGLYCPHAQTHQNDIVLCCFWTKQKHFFWTYGHSHLRYTGCLHCFQHFIDIIQNNKRGLLCPTLPPPVKKKLF